jgi:two-component sensor histidine kinase
VAVERHAKVWRRPVNGPWHGRGVGRGLAAKLEFDACLLHELFAGIDHGFCLCDVILDASGRPVDYRFVTVNTHVERMTGLAGAEGRTALEMVPDLEPQWVEDYGRVALERVAMRFERESQKMGRIFAVFAYPVEPVGRFALVFRDITAQRRMADERERALRRAEALLEEVNHRVMNSLGMMAAIVGLEARTRQEGTGRRALERIADRVQALADLYRALGAARSETSVRADAYLERVLSRLGAAIADDRNVRIRPDLAPVEVPTSVAVPLGLMVNELVTNSIKYAFGSAGGEVRVTLAPEGDVLRLVIADNGNGVADASQDHGIGQKLVNAFASQIDGTVTVDTSGTGTSVRVDFPKPEASG